MYRKVILVDIFSGGLNSLSGSAEDSPKHWSRLFKRYCSERWDYGGMLVDSGKIHRTRGLVLSNFA
jgi:hypothetical protein